MDFGAGGGDRADSRREEQVDLSSVVAAVVVGAGTDHQVVVRGLAGHSATSERSGAVFTAVAVAVVTLLVRG